MFFNYNVIDSFNIYTFLIFYFIYAFKQLILLINFYLHFFYLFVI